MRLDTCLKFIKDENKKIQKTKKENNRKSYNKKI